MTEKGSEERFSEPEHDLLNDAADALDLKGFGGYADALRKLAGAEAQQTPHAAGGELRQALENAVGWAESRKVPVKSVVDSWRKALAAQTSPAAGEGLREDYVEDLSLVVEIGARFGARQPYDGAWQEQMNIINEIVTNRRKLRRAEHPQPAPEPTHLFECECLSCKTGLSRKETQSRVQQGPAPEGKPQT
jgi:hypothetical protein